MTPGAAHDTLTHSLVAALLVALLASAPSEVAHAGSRFLVPVTQASDDPRELYERVLAPCCWTQTLDVHESELADQLRNEIVARLATGERGSAIEDDLARRFGERVRAVPRGRDPRQHVAWFTMAAMAASLLALLLLARRWSSRALARRDEPDASALAARTPEEESRLDAELAKSLRRLDS